MKIPYQLFQQLAAAIDKRSILNPKPVAFLMIPLTKAEIDTANAVGSLNELSEKGLAHGCGMFTLQADEPLDTDDNAQK